MKTMTGRYDDLQVALVDHYLDEHPDKTLADVLREALSLFLKKELDADPSFQAYADEQMQRQQAALAQQQAAMLGVTPAAAGTRTGGGRSGRKPRQTVTNRDHE